MSRERKTFHDEESSPSQFLYPLYIDIISVSWKIYIMWPDPIYRHQEMTKRGDVCLTYYKCEGTDMCPNMVIRR